MTTPTPEELDRSLQDANALAPKSLIRDVYDVLAVESDAGVMRFVGGQGVGTKLLPAVGEAIVGLCHLDGIVEINSMISGVVTTPGDTGTGTIRIAIYRGSDRFVKDKIIDITYDINTDSGIFSVGPGVPTTNPMTLTPGSYYVAMGMAVAALVTLPTVRVYTLLDVEFNSGVISQLSGTMTWTAGVAPDTLDPTDDITPADSCCPVIRFN